MAIRTLLFSRPARIFAPAGVIACLLLLAGCAGGDRSLAARTAGGLSAQLFGHALEDVKDLYIEPISLRRVALSGAAHLNRLDSQLTVRDSFGARSADALTLGYGGREVGYFAAPADGDWQGWGNLIARLIANARQVSPRLAGLPEEHVDRAVLRGMTAALDHYSRYVGPEAAGDDRAARDGFGGVGVSVDTTDHLVRVSAVTPNSPADVAGIRPEDQIVAINGVATAGFTEEDAVHQLRGPIGSTVALRVQRPGSAAARDMRLRREMVAVPTVTLSRDGDVAIVHVSGFNRTTTEHAAVALTDARRQGGGKLAGIILDLRGNGGGLLDQAVSLADLFIKEGPILSTIGRHPASHQYFAASGHAIEPQLPIAVLINGGSASASEIVASALQDAGRAVVIGSSSYGKGTVQTVLPLPNNGELILTWAGLIARSGYFLQNRGVEPTLCTANVPDDTGDIAARMQQAAAVSFAEAPRPRGSLDEHAWSRLRQLCPPSRSRPAIDVALAERLIANPNLYAEALRAVPAGTQVAAR